jgi:uncharacterized protein
MSTLATSADTARHLRRRKAAAESEGARRAARLRARLPEAVACLRERYGVTEVRLFGSLAHATCRADSDVDLAVSGLDKDRYFEALADAMRILGAPVDLVSLEEAPDCLIERIRAEGETL